jgi:hypothetical protein
MVNFDIREKLPDCALILDNESYDNSIIGVTLDGRVIYDFNLMVEEYMLDNDCSEIDVVEWIEYNTMRAIPYFGDKAPIVVNW